MIERIPLLYHPITVLLLDDNRAFLDALAMRLTLQDKIMTFSNAATVKAVR